jgi:hypothetical protein
MPFRRGFDLAEALDLVALSAIVEGGDAPPQPPGWTNIFDSPVIGPFTEKWQLWQKASDTYAIVLRGTVPDPGSILEDLISFLMLAAGNLAVGPYQFDYKFAADPQASVHFGFALGTLLLLKDPANGILVQLAAKVPAGSQLYIAGHSQGAAAATLLRSYLEYAADRPNKNYTYKTYAYAQPKPGNDHYAYDFESVFSNPGFAFRVTNSLDWVPQVPFTIELSSDINTPNPLSVLTVPSPGINVVLSGVLAGLRDEARNQIVDHVRNRFQAAMARKAAIDAAPDLLMKRFDVPIVPSLNFENAGSEISLIGTLCAGAGCKDAFFEHHATTYYKLMKAQL